MPINSSISVPPLQGLRSPDLSPGREPWEQVTELARALKGGTGKARCEHNIFMHLVAPWRIRDCV